MSALAHKLLRDLWRLRGQVLAIALVVASGVAVLVMSLSTLEALVDTSEAYYERYRFADVFGGVKRAPDRLSRRIAAIPGVQTVETRISKLALLDIDGFAEPVVGQLVSIPDGGRPVLNQLAVREGRWVEPGRPDEVILSEPFAEAHGFRPGDQISAIINNTKRSLDIVGIALSPEFVYAIGPGALMPDDKRFGVLWMSRDALAAAYDLDGAFNDVTLSLLPGASAVDVIERLDLLLARYGGLGAIERADQISNWFLNAQFDQLGTMGTVLPTIFLAVAAFLTNMVLARLIATERSEIGLLKAFGYTNTRVGWHYAQMVVLMTAVGIVIGWIAGAWLGRFNTGLYAEFYRFPFLLYRPSPSAFVIAALVSIGAALAGTLAAVRSAAALAPAEAMRPPAPATYGRSDGSESRLWRWLDQPTRIFLRQIRRWPVRAGLTSAGVALAIGVLIMAEQWIDSIDHLVQVYFFEAQHQTLAVGLAEARSERVLHEFEQMPGVLAVEPMRLASADFSAGTRRHRGTLQAMPADAVLMPAYDASGTIVDLPPEGLVVSTKLAEKLQVSLGDAVTVEVLEGRRPVENIPVVRLFETYIGMPAYLEIGAFDRLLREGPAVEYVNLLVDEAKQPALFEELKELPAIAAVMVRRAAIDKFHTTIAYNLMIFVSFFTVFAALLGFGVVYSSARIALSERGRELATLRVLGFSTWEISYVLLGEVGLLIVIALPLGCLAGMGLARLMTTAFETELYRVAPVIEAASYGTAMVVVLAAALVSAALVRRRLGKLDLIAVLKTRE